MALTARTIRTVASTRSTRRGSPPVPSSETPGEDLTVGNSAPMTNPGEIIYRFSAWATPRCDAGFGYEGGQLAVTSRLLTLGLQSWLLASCQFSVLSSQCVRCRGFFRRQPEGFRMAGLQGDIGRRDRSGRPGRELAWYYSRSY